MYMRRFLPPALSLLCLLLPLLATAQSTVSAVKPTPQPAVGLPPVVAADPDSVVTLAPTPRLFTGTVLGQDDEPLAGASVSVVTEPYDAGITNSVGNYVLRSKEASPVLHVSYAGYEPVELVLTSAEPQVIRLEAIDKYARKLKKRAKAAEKEYRRP